MPDPITVIVLVAAGSAANPTVRAMAQTTHSMLADTPVEVLETPEPSTDDDALALERAAHARAIVELTGTDVAGDRVVLRVHLARSARWIERAFSFGPADAPVERGRALGLALEAMLPEGATPPVPAAGPSPPAPASGEASAAEPPAAPNSVPGAGPALPPAIAAPSPAGDERTPKRPVAGLELLVLGTTGAAGGLGGGGGLEWFVWPFMALRAGAGVRAGNLEAAQATGLVFFGAAGVVLQPWQATPHRPFDASLRVDYLVSYESIHHLDLDDAHPVTASRWLSGAGVMLDAGWLFSSDVVAMAGVGLENEFGTTDVQDKGTPVATIPALRLAGEGGIHVRF